MPERPVHGVEPSGPPGREAGAVSRLVSWADRGLLAALVVFVSGVVLPGTGYLADLAANVAAQGAIAALAIAAWWMARGGWRTGLVALAAAAVCVISTGPASRSPRAPSGPTIRLLIFNTHTSNPDPAAVLAAIEQSGADVVVLTESARGLPRAVRVEGVLAETYPHRLVRRADAGTAEVSVVLSRWPIETGASIIRGGPEVTDCVIVSPRGEFALIALHAESPRTPERWRRGNEAVRAAALAVGYRLASGRPVLLAGDLNATPGGNRSRVLSRAGLKRAKPWAIAGGTYPASWWWPASVAIDDAWTGPGVSVASWRVAGELRAGSDHSPVVVEVVIDGGAGGQAAESITDSD